MKTVGIIAEYNPLHNGHIYNIEKAKEITGADTVICAIGSNFNQRGLPSLVSKWDRTKMALAAGADLVLEIPCLFSSQSAHFFSFAGVKVLDATGITDNLFFGTESGSLKELEQIAEILYEEPSRYKEALHSSLKNGISFPNARAHALSQIISDSSLTEMVIKPNNILALEYLISLKKLNSNMKPFTVKRFLSDHNSDVVNQNFASASLIRNMILNASADDSYKDLIPKSTYSILVDAFSKGHGPVSLENFEKLILYKVFSSTPDEIASIHEVTEGLENKIIKACYENNNIGEIIKAVKSKRYTLTRIQRIFTNILLGLTKDTFEKVKKNGPEYIRVLGFNQNGRELLKIAKKQSDLPILSNLSDHAKYNNPLISITADFEFLSTKIYSFGLKSKTDITDFSQKPIIYN